jgi:3-isopropylmalate dehydratase small subunit
MQPFTRLSGIAVPLIRDDINTDQIAPVLPLRVLEPDYAAQLFVRWRRRPDGSLDPDFVLNRPQYQRARILVAGVNFGCGSARESAVWALAAFGIGAIVARSFADLFRANCIANGVLPVVLAPDQHAAFEAQVTAVNGRGAVLRRSHRTGDPRAGWHGLSVRDRCWRAHHLARRP